jgi:hypothetical protein
MVLHVLMMQTKQLYFFEFDYLYKVATSIILVWHDFFLCETLI